MEQIISPCKSYYYIDSSQPHTFLTQCIIMLVPGDVSILTLSVRVTHAYQHTQTVFHRGNVMWRRVVTQLNKKCDNIST